MNAALLGGICALSLGTADFMGRASSRALDPQRALLGMLLASTLALSLWVWLAAPPLTWTPHGLWLVALNGLGVTVMTLLLYWGLARGPVSLVAPIVAAHPVLVVLYHVAVGDLRPDLLHWLAMPVTVLGTIIVAMNARAEGPEPNRSRRALRVTGLIAVASCLAYAVLVVAGQLAAPIYGELQTLWMGRLVSLGSLLLLFAARRQGPAVPLIWWPFLLIQGLLDAGGYLALLTGSRGDGAGIAAVTASTFGVVTVLLAWILLRERISGRQWLGVALIFGGIAVLSS